ncbi:hypothetical protein K474DRAFT_173873 [Panus rudis PR-1116 ss-1]|nr:hypothetical protein K474DRAFT_173873 [Panus rudis PR-1116 ss-1]
MLARPCLPLSSSPELPFDIIACIAEFHRGCFATIQACNLVCSTWRMAYRPFIYHTVTIDTEDRLAELTQLLETTPTIRNWVRGLRIHRDPYVDFYSPWRLSAPNDLSKWTPRLESIEFSTISMYVTLCAQPELCVEMAEGVFSRITTLRFTNGSTVSLSQLMNFLPSLKNLRHLHLASAVVSHHEDEVLPFQMTSQPSPLPLLSLHMEDILWEPFGTHSLFRSWILPSGSEKSTLTSITICGHLKELYTLWNWVYDLPGSLPSKNISTGCGDESGVVAVNIQRCEATSVKSLRINLPPELKHCLSTLSFPDVSAPGSR